MSNAPATDPSPAAAGLTRRDAAALQRVEYRRLVHLLRGLDDGAWSARTDCPEWTVREMVAHVLGALEGNAVLREGVHQMWCAWRSDRCFVDALGEVQIRDREGASPLELVGRVEATIEPAVRARVRMPGILRALPLRFTAPSGVERITLGHLLDTIYLRDAWMHRIDIARATGAPLALTADHDGRIVADVVREWSRRHRRPFHLELDGPAGGRFAEGTGGEAIRLDAVEFCRIVAGRATGPGLLTQEVLF